MSQYENSDKVEYAKVLFSIFLFEMVLSFVSEFAEIREKSMSLGKESHIGKGDLTSTYSQSNMHSLIRSVHTVDPSLSLWASKTLSGYPKQQMCN